MSERYKRQQNPNRNGSTSSRSGVTNSPANSMSLRNSLMVWVGGAVLGWVVAVVSVYGALRYTGPEVAETTQPPAPESAPAMAAAQDTPEALTPEQAQAQAQAKALQNIAPAAGGEQPDKAQ
jgi:hypothetical protein